MKKIFNIFLLLISGSFIFAQNKYSIPEAPLNVQELTMENGLEVFFLEDFSSPLIRIDFTVKAGFSDQTQNTAGFFKLYSKIFSQNFENDFFDSVECNADYTRYIFTATSSTLESKLEKFSSVIFNLSFSDELLSEQLELMKEEITANSTSAANLINSAIDSRVFSDSPWKHDSGIYPAVFKKNTEKTARTILKDLNEKFYTPQNSAIFISGNINTERTFVTLKNLFGKYYSSYAIQKEDPRPEINSHKKFVIHDPSFAKKLTQVVVQYKNLSMEQADILASVLNNNKSSFKNSTLSIDELNIPGDEYINVAAAHKKNSSRLIFQTLIQPPENKSIVTNSAKQAEEFLRLVQTIPDYFDEKELENTRLAALYELTALCKTSANFMDYLSNFWAIREFSNHRPENGMNAITEPLITIPENTVPAVRDLLYRFKTICELDQLYSTGIFNTETPYIFVIINDSDYEANKEAYNQAGYEEITAENSSWYLQSMFDNIRDQYKPDEQKIDLLYAGGNALNDNNYYLRNKNLISRTETANGIPIIYKKNILNTGVSLLINIKGGKLNSADDNGFEEVMVNILSSMIQKEVRLRQNAGTITGTPEFSVTASNYNTYILIECDTVDFNEICSAAADALIFGNIMPASADRAVNARQYKKRLENGSAVNQMYTAAVSTMFPDSDFTKIYESKKDILLHTNFNKILAAYPPLLDSSRYSFIVTGNLPDEDFSALKEGFGLLESNIHTEFVSTAKTPVFKFPKNKTQNVKIIHTFLTDIPAEKAGPQPAVLIPTTEFLDPVLYFIKSPAANSSEENSKQQALFNAVLNYIEKILQLQINKNPKLQNANVQIQLPGTNFPVGQITITNVAHTKELDSEYKNTIDALSKSLNSPLASQTIQEIKDYWIQTQMSSSITNSGTAKLIHKGFESNPDTPLPDFYLDEYNYIQTATQTDFQQILKYFPLRPEYRLYSSDSKN